MSERVKKKRDIFINFIVPKNNLLRLQIAENNTNHHNNNDKFSIPWILWEFYTNIVVHKLLKQKSSF